MNIRDIARLAGVSHSTVSRVLNNSPSVKPETRAAVEKVMADTGYRPNVFARSMSGVMAATIGVVIPDLQDPFFSTVISAVEHVAKQYQVQLLMASIVAFENAEQGAVDYLVDRGCDALIVHARTTDDALLQKLMAHNERMYLLNRNVKGFQERCFWFDNYRGGRLAAAAVLTRGRFDVAIVTDNLSSFESEERLRGIKDEFIDQGVDYDRVLIIREPPNLRGGLVAGRHILMRGTSLAAVLCFNDVMALGVMQALSDHNLRVPDDVGVVGFDDLDIASYSVPRLSTINYPVEAMAEQAAKVALAGQVDGIHDAPACIRTVWEPHFVPRESH